MLEAIKERGKVLDVRVGSDVMRQPSCMCVCMLCVHAFPCCTVVCS